MERRSFIKNIGQIGAAAIAGPSLLQYSGMSQKMAQHNPTFFHSNQHQMGTIAPTYPSVSTSFKLKGQEVKVHGLSIGTVAVKNNFRTKKGFGELAKLNILLDPNYTAYLPIWVWVIEHPEGLIVIDTGENSKVLDLDTYLAKESSFMRYQFKHAAKFQMNEKEELDQQFASIGLKPEDTKLVVLTHLHLDHTDGLKFFPKQEIMVGKEEFLHPNSNLPSTYPTWFKPNTVSYQNNRVEVFDQAYAITSAGDLLYVPTPGHTRGHSSVIFKTDEVDIIFAGDASYNQGQVLSGELAGANQDYRQTKVTYDKLLAYAKQKNTLYLPSHDETAGQRLLQRELLIKR
jgi:glyoxylase-like metal-dependent hydrolase (beta-lactamase superfamily II)